MGLVPALIVVVVLFLYFRGRVGDKETKRKMKPLVGLYLLILVAIVILVISVLARLS